MNTSQRQPGGLPPDFLRQVAMELGSNANEIHKVVDENRFEDITPWARRAGIGYPILIEPSLRATFESLAPRPDDPAEPHEPLFHLLVPLRFVLGRKPSATGFQFVAGAKLRDGGVAVCANFRCDESHGDYFVLSSGIDRESSGARNAD